MAICHSNQFINKKQLNMKLDDYAIQQLAPYMTGHKDHGANFTGRELVELFNRYGGFRDVYNNGLPQIQEGLNTARKTYAEDRLKRMNGSDNLSSLIEEIIEKSNWKEKCAEEINTILSACNYNVSKNGDKYGVSGLIIKKKLDITNTAKFESIQNNILKTLDKAKISISVAVAWFTNEELFKKLKEKKEEGLDVRVVINNDGVNKKHGIDISQINGVEIRSDRGGIMHDKFCIIDNQIVISGSYNWTDNAELKNAENVNIIENDNALATKYSLEFNKMWNQSKKKKND